MKFLCLAYYDEKKFETLPKAQVDAIVSQCPAYDEKLKKSGRLHSIASLGPSRESSSLRPRGGKVSITDGPYAEAKEIVGSFFILEAADLKEATRIASDHPAAHFGEDVGWGVEVRSIEEYVSF